MTEMQLTIFVNEQQWALPDDMKIGADLWAFTRLSHMWLGKVKHTFEEIKIGEQRWLWRITTEDYEELVRSYALFCSGPQRQHYKEFIFPTDEG